MTDQARAQAIHELKCWPKFFREIEAGLKTFEIWLNDRNFEVGDVLILKEYDPVKQQYSGREMDRTVTYITAWQQRLGYVVMGLKDETDLRAALDAEREKVKGLHEITKVICTHCCEPMEIPSKAVLQTQLTQLQALVRALVCTMGYVVDGSYILTRGGVVLYACSSSISAERLGALLAYRATLPATPTEEAT